MAYGTPTGDIPDPIVRALDGLMGEVQSLRARVNQLEGGEADLGEESFSESYDEDSDRQPSETEGSAGRSGCP